jgi:membrane protein YqaA with SNARE-associated domain
MSPNTTSTETLSFADGVTAPLVYDRLGRKVWVLGAVMLATALAALGLMLQEFSSQSYLYLLFYTIPSNSAISVFPHEPVVIYFGKHGSILLTAVAASFGTLIAGFLDHSIFVPALNLRALNGYKGKAWYQKTARLFMRFPFLVLIVTGFTPVPFFPFKFLSFSVHYPLWRYLAALLAGRFPRYVVLAWLGRLIQIPDWILMTFFALVILVAVFKILPTAIRFLKASTRPDVPLAAENQTDGAPPRASSLEDAHPQRGSRA